MKTSITNLWIRRLGAEELMDKVEHAREEALESGAPAIQHEGETGDRNVSFRMAVSGSGSASHRVHHRLPQTNLCREPGRCATPSTTHRRKPKGLVGSGTDHGPMCVGPGRGRYWRLGRNYNLRLHTALGLTPDSRG